MSSVPLKEQQLGLKESRRPSGNDNTGFASKKATSHMGENWHGKVKGKITHTYKKGGQSE